jgi:Ethanolamine utilization protein EutJ (predicted chaperonin)
LGSWLFIGLLLTQEGEWEHATPIRRVAMFYGCFHGGCWVRLGGSVEVVDHVRDMVEVRILEHAVGDSSFPQGLDLFTSDVVNNEEGSGAAVSDKHDTPGCVPREDQCHGGSRVDRVGADIGGGVTKVGLW